jgi:hypothetical protein
VFSSGNTLQTGANIVGDQNDTGDIVEVRDTFFKHVGNGRWSQDLKFGGAIQHVKDFWNFPVYPRGLMFYLNDTRAIPLVYVGTSGQPDDTVTTNLISGFVQTELRPARRVGEFGCPYDLDTDGNNPDFTSPLMPTARGRRQNNIQPRAGVSWDVTGNGRHVVRAERASSRGACCWSRRTSSGCRTVSRDSSSSSAERDRGRSAGPGDQSRRARRRRACAAARCRRATVMPS